MKLNNWSWVVLALATAITATAEAQTVWQIGKFDESPVEFTRAPQDNVTFEVGKNNAGTDWPRRQITGHPYRILFALESTSGSYTLKVATLIERPRVPALHIDVNGHAGTFFLHPKLSYSRSDFSYAFDPHESQSTVDIEVPASFLKSGQNAITITCVDEPATPAGAEEIGGISYDALSLEQDAARAEPERDAQVQVEPTILYRQTPAGLAEVVDAFVRFAASMASRPRRSRSERAAVHSGFPGRGIRRAAAFVRCSRVERNSSWQSSVVCRAEASGGGESDPGA